MIPDYFSAIWTAMAPALGNHLWQSTLFAGAAGLLTLLLRKNRARGVTGADLKKRITRIMTQRVGARLSLPRMLLLAGIALMAVSAPVVYGLLHPSQNQNASPAPTPTAPALAFDVVSIKPVKSDNGGMSRTRFMMTPDGLEFSNVTVRNLIRMAYGVEDHQITGAPGGLDSDRYNVETKLEPSVMEAFRKLSPDDQGIAQQNMMQAILADRFQLKIHRDSKELPVYALVVAKNGPKLHEAKPGDTYPNGIKRPDGTRLGGGSIRVGRGELTAQGLPMASIAMSLSRQVGRTVRDKTGLTGIYDFTLHWTPEEGTAPMMGTPAGGPQGPNSATPPDSSGPSIFTAIQEQLGLKLESQKGPVEMIVIDHVEKPSEN
jgi:bla regulator protein blaR1